MQQLVELQFKKSAMKTNQIFNFKRFINYSESSLLTQYRILLLLLGVASGGLFLLCSFTLMVNGNGWTNKDWANFIIFVIPVAGLLYAGSAFPYLRTRERVQNYLMIPASLFEKFLFEFFIRVILFCVLFPILLYLFGNLSFTFVQIIKHAFKIDFSANSLSYLEILAGTDNQIRWMSIVFIFFIPVIVFAGAATFRKYPIVKSIIFYSFVFLIGFSYLFLIRGILHFYSPWLVVIANMIDGNEPAFVMLAVFMIITGLFSLIFTYFKLKEKEVQ
jgi:hypothetical protein